MGGIPLDASLKHSAHHHPTIELAVHLLALLAICTLLLSALVWTVGTLAGNWPSPSIHDSTLGILLFGLLVLYCCWAGLCIHLSAWKGLFGVLVEKRPLRTMLALCAAGIVPAIIWKLLRLPEALKLAVVSWTCCYLPLLLCLNRLSQLSIPYRKQSLDPSRLKPKSASFVNQPIAVYLPSTTHWAPTLIHGGAYAVSAAVLLVLLIQICWVVGLATTGHPVLVPERSDGLGLVRTFFVMGQLTYVGFTIPYLVGHARAAKGGSLRRVTRPLVVVVLGILLASIWFATENQLLPPLLAGLSRAASRSYSSPEMWAYGEVILSNVPPCLLGCVTLMIAAQAFSTAYAVRSVNRVFVWYPPRLSWLAEIDRLDWEEWQRKNGVN